MLQVNLQGKKKAFVALHFRQSDILHAEIPQYCNNSKWIVEYLDVFGNKKSSVLGWTNFRLKAWFLDRE